MINPRWALAPFVAVALGLLVACGGDDDDGDSNATTTTQTTTSATQSSAGGATSTGSTGATTETSSQGTSQSGTLDVGNIVQNLEDVDSFRFDVSIQMDFDTPEAAGSSGSQDDAAAAAMIAALFGNIQASGEYVAPDRYHIETTLFGMKVEVIQIGDKSWTNDGSGWTEDSEAGEFALPFGNSPSDLPFDMIPAEQLEGAETSKETVNGIETTRYHFDKEAVAALAESSGDPDDLADLEELDTLDLNVWLTDDGIPIKMVMQAAGESEGSDVSINMEFNVSDLNDDGIKIEPPL